MEMVYLILVIVLIISVYNCKLVKSKRLGKIGERKVAKKLKKIKDAVLINDLRFHTKNNMTCQIDHILICSKGIFVIETKNYSGRIYGSDNQLEWLQIFNYGKNKYKFYSPVKQNNTHVYELSKRLNTNNINNCVVFVNNNTTYIKSEYVYNFKRFDKYILEKKDILSKEQIDAYGQKILQLKENISNKEHIKNIKNQEDSIINNICPRCGNDLIVKQNNNINFYGCSNFPKCKFTKKKNN